MALFRVELTEQDLVQVIGEYVKKKYSLDRDEVITVAWQGETPLGVIIMTKPSMEPYKNPFEED